MHGCAFWGSRWWIITFRGPKSPKTSFWGPELAFQAKYVNNSNSYIVRSVYQIDMKFDGQLQPPTETSWVVSYGGKTIPRWRMAAILKRVISPYLSEKSSDFDEIVYTAVDFELSPCACSKWKSCSGQTSSLTERIYFLFYLFLIFTV